MDPISVYIILGNFYFVLLFHFNSTGGTLRVMLLPMSWKTDIITDRIVRILEECITFRIIQFTSFYTYISVCVCVCVCTVQYSTVQ